MKRSRVLLSTVLPLALAAGLALTGCSNDAGNKGGDDKNEGSNSACAPAGAASDSVKVAGKFGEAVTIEAKTPLTTKSLERTVTIAGKGEKVKEGESISTQMTVFNGKTGEIAAPGAPTTVLNSEGQVAPWALTSLKCSSVGDRLVIVAPATDVIPEEGLAQYKLEKGDSMVIVFDLLKLAPKPLERADGKKLTAPALFPKVSLDDKGKPTITIPKGQKAPTKLEVATLIEGKGEAVKATDLVTLNYTGVVWSSGKQFDSSWDSGNVLTLGANQFVKGFTDAIVGKKVGSQIIAVIPAELGYGEQTKERLKSADATKDDVMVFVIDILGTSRTE